MLSTSIRRPAAVATALALLLVLTRGEHFATAWGLPGASWAVFFLAGAWLRAAWALPGLLALAWLCDFVAAASGSADPFCLSPAYVFLLPAYAALWAAGRFWAHRHRSTGRTALPLALALTGGALVCELISSAGFYWFSGHFAAPTLAEFAARFASWFPRSLLALVAYVILAGGVQALAAKVRGPAPGRRASGPA